MVQSSFEELSILLSLKDHLLPQLSDSASLDTFVLLLSDLFPGCRVAEILAHETGLREELATRAAEDREEAGNSARESRAASAMMVVREDARPPSEGPWSLWSLRVCVSMCVRGGGGGSICM